MDSELLAVFATQRWSHPGCAVLYLVSEFLLSNDASSKDRRDIPESAFISAASFCLDWLAGSLADLSAPVSPVRRVHG